MRCLKCHCDLNKFKPTKRGWRYNKKGRIQKYSCSRCGYKFVKGGIAFRMKHPRWNILKAIELRERGYSFDMIAKEIGGVTRQTIYKWIRDRVKKKNKIIIIQRKIRGHLREGKIVKEHIAKIPIKI